MEPNEIEEASKPVNIKIAERTPLKKIVYKCAQCTAVDSCQYYPNEVITPAINCWKCGAGRGKNIEQMMVNTIGMFKVGDQEPA